MISSVARAWAAEGSSSSSSTSLTSEGAAAVCANSRNPASILINVLLVIENQTILYSRTPCLLRKHKAFPIEIKGLCGYSSVELRTVSQYRGLSAADHQGPMRAH